VRFSDSTGLRLQLHVLNASSDGEIDLAFCEQAHQQLKKELGLYHFEGQTWQGLHRHALMTMIAYLQYASHKLGGKKNQRSASAKPAGGVPRHRRSPPSMMPILQKANP
jgi:SRSO17 transposase